MPWTGKSFAKHNHALTPFQAKRAAKQANAVLKSSGDEGLAITVANKNARSERMYGSKKGVRHG